MRRIRFVLLAISLFAITLPARSSAVPFLVEMKIKEPLSSVNSSVPYADDQLNLPGNGYANGKGNGNSSSAGGSASEKSNPGKGNKPDDLLTKGNLKDLTLWYSTNGKDWKVLGGEVVDLGSDKITARVDSKGNTTIDEAMSTFGLPGSNTTGEVPQTYFIGVSGGPSGSKSFSGSTYSAQLISWQYVSYHLASETGSQTISIPEPGMWHLLTMGVLGVGLVVGKRKKH
jgi:hypothetical protein